MANTDEAGGNAQKYYNDIRINMKESKKLVKTEETLEGKESIPFGVESEIWSTKNRYSAPYVKAIITIIFGKGVSNLSAYQRVLMSEGVLKMAGAGFWKLKLPDKEELSSRGPSGCLDLIKDNFVDVKEFVNSHG